MHRLKKNIGNIIKITLAIVVLMSTSGFKIYSHHCNTTHTHNYSIFIPAEECQHAKAESLQSCCHKQDTTTKTKDCCKNESKTVKLSTDTIISHTSPILEAIELNISIDHLLLNQNKLALNNSYQNFLIQESPPPFLVPEYLSLIQVYII